MFFGNDGRDRPAAAKFLALLVDDEILSCSVESIETSALSSVFSTLLDDVLAGFSNQQGDLELLVQLIRHQGALDLDFLDIILVNDGISLAPFTTKADISIATKKINNALSSQGTHIVRRGTVPSNFPSLLALFEACVTDFAQDESYVAGLPPIFFVAISSMEGNAYAEQIWDRWKTLASASLKAKVRLLILDELKGGLVDIEARRRSVVYVCQVPHSLF